MTTPNINRLLRARPRPCTYGAPLGASNYDDAPPDARRYCQRVRFHDGGYGPDGTYWGGYGRGVLPLWAVFTADLETLCYYRAWSRAAALERHFPHICESCGAKHRNEFSRTCARCDELRESGDLEVSE